MKLDVKVKINESTVQNKLNELLDDKTKLEINNLFAKMCDPYVPMLNGPLHESGLANVTPEYIQYNVPYARYQYYGMNFNHTVEFHPLATALWDKVMMQDRGQEFINQVEMILRRRATELYG